MVFSDDEDEAKTYSVKEIRERCALEKAKASTERDDLMSKYFERLKVLDDKVALSAPPRIPTPEALSDGVVGAASTSGHPKTPGPYPAIPYEYPKTNSIMHHINHCGPASHFDGTHFPFWKTSMESHLRTFSEELWDVVVKGFSAIDPDNMSP
jgi:hypothetical protein